MSKSEKQCVPNKTRQSRLKRPTLFTPKKLKPPERNIWIRFKRLLKSIKRE
jgi:hypothetical protein